MFLFTKKSVPLQGYWQGGGGGESANINLCIAELFVSIFQSFEAGIANTISSFK